MVNSLVFKEKFLPSTFTPPLLTYQFDNKESTPTLLLEPPSSSIGSPLLQVLDATILPEDLRAMIPTWTSLIPSILPFGWPKDLPFRRFSCLGHLFFHSMPINSSIHFPNFVIDQSTTEVLVIIDLVTVTDRFEYELSRIAAAAYSASTSQIVRSLLALFNFCSVHLNLN